MGEIEPSFRGFARWRSFLPLLERPFAEPLNNIVTYRQPMNDQSLWNHHQPSLSASQQVPEDHFPASPDKSASQDSVSAVKEAVCRDSGVLSTRRQGNPNQPFFLTLSETICWISACQTRHSPPKSNAQWR